ncbi:hypothetical protein EYW47_10600 [Paraburkholderia silviterrae]|uniref:Uncharacterized protein n=1 Tax=Paraburkholderia silviterrae TaxID=2528715 RepID=A0A4R5MCN4_9BURK|nr:hypothetical protein EYW47_10600 [Paraburkholderia silviterrae]
MAKSAEQGEWTKKKRAWSPLKTTRYGVSARRPNEEPDLGASKTPVTAPARMPQQGLRHDADRQVYRVRSHLHRATSVLKPLKALWAN